MGNDCNDLFEYTKRNKCLRDAELREYVGSDHASVAAVALADGIQYFVLRRLVDVCNDGVPSTYLWHNLARAQCNLLGYTVP